MAIGEKNKSYSLSGTTAEELIELKTSLKIKENKSTSTANRSALTTAIGKVPKWFG